jgi:tetratricopeptide (TPR) repeat protein
MLDPNNTDALFLLGRAYFVLNSYKMAQSYFLQVLDNNPSPLLRLKTEQYLKLINERAPELRLPTRGTITKYLFANLTSGYDSNINGATTSSVFVLPVGILNLFPSQTKKSDGFGDGFIKGGIGKTINDNLGIFADASAEGHFNYTVPGFNYSIFNGDIGATFTKGDYQIIVPLGVQQIYTGNSSFERYVVLASILSRTFRTNNSVGVLTSVQAIDYPQTNNRQQYQSFFAGNTVLQFPLICTRFTGSIYYGDGKALDQTGAYLIRDFSGVQGLLEWLRWKHNTPFISSIIQDSNYTGTDPAFLKRRHDYYYSVGVGWNWNFTKHWNLQPQYIQIWNKSNIAIYKYNRSVAQVSLIYLWS